MAKVQQIRKYDEDILTENLPIGILQLEVDGHILYANRLAYRILGFSVPEKGEAQKAIAKFHAFLTPESREDFKLAVDQVVLQGKINSGIYRIVRPNNKVIQPLRIFISKDATSSFGLTLLVVITPDIQPELLLQKDAEIKRTKSEEAPHAAFLSLVSAGLAHEINNPLTILQGTSEVFKRCLDQELLDRDKLTRLAIRIEQMVGKIGRIVNALTLVGDNKKHRSVKPCRLKNLIDDSVAFFENQFRDHQISIEIDDVPEAFILCRRGEIIEVLLNLLKNSCDAVSKTPNSWIAVRFVTEPGCIMISITDSGKGLSSEVAGNVMIPFFTTKKVSKGSGLGLYVSKSLVQKHGGDLFLNRQSANTQFIVRLPAEFPQKP